MRTIRAALAPAAALVLGALALAGCGADPNAKVLANAVYAKSIPVYKGAHFTETSGNESWGDDPNSYTQGTTWWFETKATQAEMLAFYEKLYPSAEKLEIETGGVELTIRPEGAATAFEDVTIYVCDHELRIGESVSPNTKARLRGEPVADPGPPVEASDGN